MIGIFDSGIGGLTVAKEIMKVLPKYQLIYYGDTARTPYGGRSAEAVYNFTIEALDYLFKQDCQLIILACNTATALALRKIQQEWLVKNYPDRKVLGVIRPVAEFAAKNFSKSRIGVVGTKGTVNSGAYIEEIKKLNPQAEIFQQACPLLVPLIEEGWHNKPETTKILQYYLRPLKNKKIGALILGCTHYPLIYNKFEKIMGKRCAVLNSGEIAAVSLKDYLTRHPEIEKKLKLGKNHKFLATDLNNNYGNIARLFIKKAINWQKI